MPSAACLPPSLLLPAWAHAHSHGCQVGGITLLVSSRPFCAQRAALLPCPTPIAGAGGRVSKALLHQAQRRGRDEAFASPRMCPPASRPSEGAARHPLPSSFPVTDEVGLPGAPHIPGASGWGGRERGEEGGKSFFGHGGIKGRSRSVCAPLTPRWVLLLPECSQRSPWEL